MVMTRGNVTKQVSVGKNCSNPKEATPKGYKKGGLVKKAKMKPMSDKKMGKK